jgi:hypothetical protein
MSGPWRRILLSLALLFAALGAILVRQQREISRLRAAVSAQAAELADHQSDVEQLSGQLAAEQQALRRRAAENARLASALGLDAAELSFWRSERLREAARRYGPELAALGLGPEKRDALLALLADRTDAMRDAREIALREGIAAGSGAMNDAIEAAAADVEADIRGLIGAAAAGLFPAPVPAGSAPAATVAVYASPPVAAPVASPLAPAEGVLAPAPAYAAAPADAPFVPVLLISSFGGEGGGRNRRFAGPRTEPGRPVRTAPLAAPPGGGAGRVLPYLGRATPFR